MADLRSRLPERAPLRLAVVGMPLLVLAVLVAVLIGGALSDDDVDGRTASSGEGGDAGQDPTGSDPDQRGSEGSDDNEADDPLALDQSAAALIEDPYTVPPEELPLEAEVSNTTGLSDGDVVTIHVEADEGSEIYALEARLCAGDAVIEGDSDIRPTQTGKCVPQPLSPSSDAYVEALNNPPYQELDASFRVGEGTTTYTTQEGQEVTITCDRDHPCLIAVKYQIPNGYGFLTYPVEYR